MYLRVIILIPIIVLYKPTIQVNPNLEKLLTQITIQPIKIMLSNKNLQLPDKIITKNNLLINYNQIQCHKAPKFLLNKKIKCNFNNNKFNNPNQNNYSNKNKFKIYLH